MVAIEVRPVPSKSNLQASSAPNEPKSSRGGMNDTLLVLLATLVFLAVVWLYAVHRLYINHINDPVSLVRDD
eukprot:CAMPEP_0202887116 /NCGR_PEP_ID=MMETSP1391-20130828/42519_1 /ASSEMBLY_ACC=CAM_ASM_000867 /TAXON_ID=1034604 /ORGANISM="Chlamydomonas leiostraca, Strain SAG 11-49" /LENGTH=71 /DNA_ID=CAMNT_0049570393 /DNA_START=136 /DNA_END=351 /DNA_ORIENTATION=-